MRISSEKLKTDVENFRPENLMDELLGPVGKDNKKEKEFDHVNLMRKTYFQ